jgi:hypothetical protein
MSSERFLEIYSGNRNRLLYPIQSYFEIPFAPSLQNVDYKQYQDQNVNGSIYFSYCLSTKDTPIVIGTFKEIVTGIPYTSNINAYLDPNQNPTGIFLNNVPGYLNISFYSLVPNYYKGYVLVDDSSGESKLITSYDPSTGFVTFSEPFFTTLTSGNTYSIYPPLPTSNYVFVPSLDVNYNLSLDYESSYNGYYIVFETPNQFYSNSLNSNIFYRKISYYDSVRRLAYFEEPLPFDYTETLNIQEFTIRKNLPLERWTLDTETYNNRICQNPLVGPLIGLVITLPQGASTVDNYYKGKYVYFSGNQAESYDPPYPNPDILDLPIPNTFYPIYGLYYIKAYNGTTRELSVCQDLIQTSCTPVIANFSPPTFKILNYNSSSFDGQDGFLTPVNIGGSEYFAQPTLIECCPYTGILFLNPQLYETGRKYKITWRLKYQDMDSAFFEVIGSSETYLSTYSDTMSNVYKTFEFTIKPIKPVLYFRFYMDAAVTTPDTGIIWDLFEMQTVDTINICSFSKEIAQPLNYTGTIVSQNEPVCYDISLLNLTLPNLPLLTGSRIAFYPYVYVELTNVTAPIKAAPGTIYSNNPNSKRALFIAAVGQVAQPTLGTFLTLFCNMKKTVKFKPNDNLLFRVFLPDGTLFQTLLPDTLPPYVPDPRLQIQATFSITRKGKDSFDK